MPGVTFLIPGGAAHLERRGSLALLPHHSDLYHPDLVEASDAVIGKLGYSTLAEAYHAGLPYAYIPRPRFRESPAMSGFVLEHMHGMEISEETFYAGQWLELVPRLLAIPRQRPLQPNGADQIATYLLMR
jgi:UDP-N-acetylglucosamine:LPS N-acetylglucosamine transferase